MAFRTFHFSDPNFYKDHFGVAGRPVLLTFGLLSPGKGIEYAIQGFA
jgi:glycosyltransferase involved in cell wall biosynthesis